MTAQVGVFDSQSEIAFHIVDSMVLVSQWKMKHQQVSHEILYNIPSIEVYALNCHSFCCINDRCHVGRFLIPNGLLSTLLMNFWILVMLNGAMVASDVWCAVYHTFSLITNIPKKDIYYKTTSFFIVALWYYLLLISKIDSSGCSFQMNKWCPKF